MAKNKKRRRQGRPGGKLTREEMLFIARTRFTSKDVLSEPLPADHVEHQHTALVAALDDLKTGTVTVEHATSLQAQINETMKLFEMDVFEESADHLEVCTAARDALLAAVVRANGSSQFMATDAELVCLREFADLRVELMRSGAFTLGDSYAARREVLNCFRRGHFDHVQGPAMVKQGEPANA